MCAIGRSPATAPRSLPELASGRVLPANVTSCAASIGCVISPGCCATAGPGGAPETAARTTAARIARPNIIRIGSRSNNEAICHRYTAVGYQLLVDGPQKRSDPG